MFANNLFTKSSSSCASSSLPSSLPIRQLQSLLLCCLLLNHSAVMPYLLKKYIYVSPRSLPGHRRSVVTMHICTQCVRQSEAFIIIFHVHKRNYENCMRESNNFLSALILSSSLFLGIVRMKRLITRSCRYRRQNYFYCFFFDFLTKCRKRKILKLHFVSQTQLSRKKFFWIIKITSTSSSRPITVHKNLLQIIRSKFRLYFT